MKFAEPAASKNGAYLFCYFLGNRPNEERICFAVSKDGYNFTPLNDNRPVIEQKLGTRCCRDPFILRGNDCFYIVATDMKSDDGWESNHGIVTFKSDDLIHWYDECAVDFHSFDSTADADKIWAPQAMYDEKTKKYMVYFSCHNKNSEKPLAIWYTYTADFKTFSKPSELFSSRSGLDVIDADIVKKDGKYHMYYKDECVKTVAHSISDSLCGEYREYDNNVVSCTERHVEGNCMYNITGTDTYVMIMDLYVDGGYYMQQTEDMMNFLPVDKKDFSLDFHPRHGSMLHITDDEYYILIKNFSK